MRTTFTFSIVLSLLAGCGGGGSAFGPTYPDNRQADLDAVASRLASAPAPDGAIAVGIATNPQGLFAYDLAAGRLLWNEATTLGTIPHLAGDYVVSEEGDDLVVRRLADGVVTARTERRGLRLVGGAGEGATGAAVLSTTGGAAAESILFGLSRGSIAQRYRVDQALGEPAVRAGMIFVPWGHQNVSVIDATTGAELARLRVREVVGHAVAYGREVFVGQNALARFSSGLVSDPEWLTPSEAERSSGANLFDDAYAPPPAAVSAAHHVRMAFAPIAGGEGHGAGFEGGALYEVFYRAVFALEGSGGAPRWAALNRVDVVGAAASSTGIFIADEAGTLSLLDGATGQARWTTSIGIESSYVALRVEGFAPSGSPSGDVLPLPDQLLTVAADTDARLVPARAFAVRLLGASSEPAVTTHLITLCEDRSAAPAVHAAACETLGERTLGGDQVVAALGRHAAFLTGTSAPPVGPLAHAALAMGERRAVPLLLAQLVDPNTAASDLAALLEALGAFGDTTALAPLADWLRLYHAETDDSGMGEALVAGARAYATLSGPTAADLLQPLLADPSTHPLLRQAAQTLLAPPEAEGEAEGDDADAAGLPEARVEATTDPRTASSTYSDADADGTEVRADVPAPLPPSADTPLTVRAPAALPVDAAMEGRFAAEVARERAQAQRAAAARATAIAARSSGRETPAHLTPELVEEALRDFRVALRACLVTPRLTFARARVALVVEPTGALMVVHVTPTELQGCIEPLVRSTSYPASSARRQQIITFEIRR